MKNFKNRVLVKIFVSLCLVLTLINIGVPNKTYAEYGGILLNPVTKLLTSIADGVISLLHKTIQYQDLAFVEISGINKWWENLGERALAIVITVILSAILIGVALVTGMAAFAAGSGLLKVILVAGTVFVADVTIVPKLTGGDTTTQFAGKFVAERIMNAFSDTLYMPAFTITPGQIFSNKVPIFDINFFNPAMLDEDNDGKPDTIVQVTTGGVVGYSEKVTVYYDHYETIRKDTGWEDGIQNANVIIDKEKVSVTSTEDYRYESLKSSLRNLMVSNSRTNYTMTDIENCLSEADKTLLKSIITEIDGALDIEEDGIDAVNTNADIVIGSSEENGADRKPV